jgi:deazaflavin-dependent oxidoreductase (nitroreductase family)
MPETMRKFFKFLNKFFMVPMFRLGLGPVMVNPFSGYIMVMKTIGRKSGKVRYVPVNYAIWKGDAYCISGGREHADWYRNLQAHPEIEVMLPGGAIYVSVETGCQGEDRVDIIRQILKNGGFAGFFEGYNPWKISNAELTMKTADLPLIRVHPTGIGNGPADAKGWAWIGWLAVVVVIILFIFLK